MLAISGCGRQVTGLNQPNAGAIVPVGQTLIRFETAGQLSFQNVTYLIVLNTSGNGQQPYAQGFQNSDFKNWSAYFIVGGGQGFANFPGLFQIFQDPASGNANKFQVPIPANALNFQTQIPNVNSQFGFQITFNRCLLDLPPPSANPPPPVTSNRTCPPYTYIATNWNVSIFTLDSTNSPIDSLGTTGPNDTSYKFGFDTAQLIATNNFKPGGSATVQNPAAQIIGIEVFSTPSNGAVSSPSPVPSPSTSPSASPSRAPVSRF
ncbi:MAG: hypothetical protein QOJ39_2381 [Candidatus Eremiobacteraeota bacterium]|jgi:hypothetical protein|nr:hypothetical protein [Candidatus Eremiobacteraeota bacterium]